jgi:hypothetical protein
MTYKPKALADAMAYWVAHGGADGGIVGDEAHSKRATYHNGWDRTVARLGTTNMAVVAERDYTYRQKRDQVKSDAAMGIDLSWPLANKRPLWEFSSWLVAQSKLSAPDTADIREVIWSPDGIYVKRWDHVSQKVYTSLRKNADGTITVITPFQGDDTHYWHTHASNYRDSEARASLLALLRRYFEEDDMVRPAFGAPEKDTVAWLKNNPANPAESVVLHWYDDFRNDARNIRCSATGTSPRQKNAAGFYELP